MSGLGSISSTVKETKKRVWGVEGRKGRERKEKKIKNQRYSSLKINRLIFYMANKYRAFLLVVSLLFYPTTTVKSQRLFYLL
jgi:hypothetical protein